MQEDIMGKAKLYDLAQIIRSKNSGPFSITLDVLFDDPEIYKKIKEGGFINKEVISQLYQIEPESITQIVFFDPAQGVKVTFDRKISSGTSFDTDVYGAQQHAPLGGYEVDL